MTNIIDHGNYLKVNISDTKTDTPRWFVIIEPFYKTVKKYMSLRPEKCKLNEFFINYTNGKCTQQPIGINKLGSMTKKIAKFLNLPNPHRYTSHCLRHPTATTFANTGAGTLQLKQLGGWKSTEIAHYVQNSLLNKKNIAERIKTSLVTASNISTSKAQEVPANTSSFKTVAELNNDPPQLLVLFLILLRLKLRLVHQKIRQGILMEMNLQNQQLILFKTKKLTLRFNHLWHTERCRFHKKY